MKVRLNNVMTKNSFNKYSEAMNHINKVKSGLNSVDAAVFKLTNYLANQLSLSPKKVRELAFEAVCKVRCRT